MHCVLAVAAEAVDVPPLPPLVDRIRHQQAVPHGVRRRGGLRPSPPPRRPRDNDRGRNPSAEQATPHEVLRPHVPSPSLDCTVSRRQRAATGASGSSVRCTRRGSDRKSTRLNSSHLVISYAVFCL